MYLVLRPPWGPRVTTSASGNPPVVVVRNDAGVPKPAKKKRTRPRPTGTPAGHAGDRDGEGDSEPEPAALAVLTASDRALEWRGEDVALPPRTVDLAGGEARGLEDGEINRVIGSQAGGVKDCVVQAATHTDLRATITVKLLVDSRGKVTRSRIQAPRFLFEQGLLGCAQRALGRVHFPATGAPTVVTLPVNLG